MAKKDKVDEVDDVEENKAELLAKAVEAAARKKKMLLLVAVGVVLLLVAGGGTWVALRLMSSDNAAPAEVKEGEPAPAAEVAEAAAKGKPKESFYRAFEPAFLANYQVGGKQHYLQIALAVLARDEAALEAVTTHMPLLRNRIVLLLSGETFEALQSDAGRVQLQQTILAAIQEIMQKETGKPQIEQVFFTTFVMQ